VNPSPLALLEVWRWSFLPQQVMTPSLESAHPKSVRMASAAKGMSVGTAVRLSALVP
jgi:hypothetical protein